MIDDRLNTRWHSCSTEFEVENILHHGGLRLVNREDFLDLLSALFGIGSAIAERWPRTVPEALAGVLAHRAQCVLTVLAALIFVEAAENMPNQISRRIVLKILRHGNRWQWVGGAIQAAWD
jgi:hypothetical protein